MNSEKQKKRSANLTDLNEAMGAYFIKINKTSTVKIELGGVTYADIFENKMLIIRIIREGLPSHIFNKIKDVSPFTEDEWAAYLNLSKKTLLRHRNNTNYLFKPIHTEKIIELAEVTNFGKEVFDSAEQFYQWLNTPSYALGKLKPSELLKDSYGKELVMGELNRIDQGIFA